MQKLVTDYYNLAKPGIIYGNALTAAGGFLLASRGNIDPVLFFSMLFGISFVIGSACVLNNYIDRDLDKKMRRTNRRALAMGRIGSSHAFVYAAVLALIGFILLSFTNALAVMLGLIGMVAYVVLYGYSKRLSPWGTEVGSISGAIPITVGYTAFTGAFDAGAVLLFLILVAWQMPHFYAIAVFRKSDYQAAGIPVLPIAKGMAITKQRMLVYVIAFIILTAMLTVLGYTGYVYLIAMLALGFRWLQLTLQGFGGVDENKWARDLFKFSLVIILAFSILISVDVLIP